MAMTWRQRYEAAKPAHVTSLGKAFAGIPAGATLLIPEPRLVERHVRRVRTGRTLEVATLRERMAREAGAQAACPVTTAIHLRIVAELALEALAGGEASTGVTPFWRVVAPDSPLASKLSCGPGFIRRQREAERAA